VFAARELVRLAFRAKEFRRDGKVCRIDEVDYDVLRNLFWVVTAGGARIPLDRAVYDEIYEPLTSTFCGNPFVDPDGMDRTLETYAELMFKAKVHTGVIRTQLGRAGYEFAGPAKAAEDIVTFLLEDEEVNARFQRNKEKVHQAMRTTFGGVLEAGSNLPVELEGYNLLLLEEHESTHVSFLDADGRPFTLCTPLFQAGLEDDEPNGDFAPAITLPENAAVIRDICLNRDYVVVARDLDVDLGPYECIGYWGGIEELTYQVLLLNGVIGLGSSDDEVARFPFEVKKARLVAERIARERKPRLGVSLPRGSVFPSPRGVDDIPYPGSGNDYEPALASPRRTS
jgi:hypothetical protein